MDLVVKRMILGDRPMFGVCQVTNRDGAKVTAWELLHLKTGEPWAFSNTYWASKKQRAFAPESADYLCQAGIDVPEMV